MVSAAAPATTSSPAHSAQVRLSGPATALQERYGGDSVGCQAFLLACELYLCPELTSMPKVSLVIQWLTGRALEWAAAIRLRGGATTTDYDAFLKEFTAVFDHPNQGQSSSQRLLQLRQGSGSAADYSISFRTRPPTADGMKPC